ncbi:alpha/beta hydrolase [Methylobacterium durans]|uniref:alpha/beta hydrolase n=1 Tax=Methylobacterium durans TaxID=2202825 RepID=UPI002AFF800E|nr:alpha/beta hydrolase [Methylobacterium durans]MEA1832450.1 alpha/beta hydrolase [Methylobacterium durans]
MASSEIDRVRALLVSRPRPSDLAERRERLDWLGSLSTMPGDVRVEPAEAGGVPAEWTSTPGADPARVLLFLHGGGYVSGSLASHRVMVAEAGREARARTLALAYRLAPEHPFPAALEDALAAYRFLLGSGIAAERICLGGESAGGGLALATLIRLREAGEPMPGCLWCASPWVDLEMSGASIETKDAVDPIIHRPYLAELATAYLNGADPRGPLVSPLHADLARLPPTLIQVGSAETLLDDSVRLAGALAAADVAVTLSVWPQMIHAWHLFHQQLAQGRASLAQLGRFVRSHLAEQA